MAVVDLEPLQGARGDLENRGVRPKTRDPLADDHAIADRVERRTAGGAVVDALIDGAADDVLPRERKSDPVGQHVG